MERAVGLFALVASACPTAKGLETDPWKRLRAPRQLGEPLTVSITKGTVTVSSPSRVADTRPPSTFTCPAK